MPSRIRAVRESNVFRILTVLLIMGLIVSVTIAVMLGPVHIAAVSVWKIIASHLPGWQVNISENWHQGQEYIIWDIRLPRVLMAIFTGAGLAVAGVGMQALLRNSLADPYILGLSSGAAVAATLVILFGAFRLLGQYALSLSAFLGAAIAMALVYALARVRQEITTGRLLLAGIAVSMTLSAVTSFIVTLAPREEGIRSVMYWMMGSLSGAKWEYLTLPAVVVSASTGLLLLQHRALNSLLLGEETAVTLGINIDSFRRFLVLITAVLTGTIVAVSGAIGFVGLMIPHTVRLLVGADHRRVLPISMFLGAIFLIWADVAARLVLAPEELPLGIVTALCGGPFFIWLLRRGSYSFGGRQ